MSLQEKPQKPNPWIDPQKAQNRPQTDPKSSFLVPHSGSLTALGSQVSTDGEFWSSKLPNGPPKGSRKGVQIRSFFGTNFEARILSHSGAQNGSKRVRKAPPKRSFSEMSNLAKSMYCCSKSHFLLSQNGARFQTTFRTPPRYAFQAILGSMKVSMIGAFGLRVGSSFWIPFPGISQRPAPAMEEGTFPAGRGLKILLI